MTLLMASLLDASVVLALALAATLLLRRRSAALRHAVLAIAIVCALLMPALEWLLPAVPVIPWPSNAITQSSGITLASGVTETGLEATPAAPAASGRSWTSVVGGVWLLGSLAAMAGLLIGVLRLARLRRRCTPVGGPRRTQSDGLARAYGVRRPVALFQSDDRTQPLTYGVFRPGIIVPADATRWSDERWDIVFRHELAHIARYDAGLQVASELLRILQPLNPLVWIAGRRLRQESEYACDDEVLGGGVNPADYASQLLEIARSLSDRPVAIAAAPAIAHTSTLERRISAMLQTTKNRTPLTRRGWRIAIGAALSLCLPLAAAGIAPVSAVVPSAEDLSREAPTLSRVPLAGPQAPAPEPAPTRRPVAPPQVASVAGQVVDQTGGTMPGVTMTLTDRQTSEPVTAVTDAAGRFAFRDLPPAEYTLTGTMPGFMTLTATLTLSPGTTVTPRLTMALGTLSESITVLCGTEPFSLGRVFFPVLEASQAGVTPIRVGGSIRVPKKIRDVKPTCADTSVTDDIRVTLTGRIDVEGAMTAVALDESEAGISPPADLVTAAIEAVRQWRFTPTELNRQPVEVGIRINITFKPR